MAWAKMQEPAPRLLWLSGLSVSHRPKGARFDSGSGPVPGLQVRSASWGCARGNQSHINVSLSVFLPPFPFL